MLEIHPVTADRWEELASFFGPSGAFSHCWCTWWRQTAADPIRGVVEQGAANRALMRRIVEAGSEPGARSWSCGETSRIKPPIPLDYRGRFGA